MREMTKMLASPEQENVARAFLAARAEKTPLTAYPGAMPQTMAEAYAIQGAAIGLDGRRVGGWKVGRIPADIVERFQDNRLAGPIFSDEIFDGSAGQAPAMRWPPKRATSSSAIRPTFQPPIGRPSKAIAESWIA